MEQEDPQKSDPPMENLEKKDIDPDQTKRRKLNPLKDQTNGRN